MIRSAALLCAVAALAGAETGYRLFPGDLIRVQVFDHEDLTIDLRVPDSGTTAFPLIGDLGALRDRPVPALVADLTRRLGRDYLVDPVVTLTVTEFGPRQAFVMGAVKDGGAVPLDPQLPKTAIQAIGQAGGFEDDADRSATVIIRRDPADPARVQAIPVPATDRTEALAADRPLDHGDVVIVPRLDRIYVIGMVQQPGAVALPTREVLTVGKAISLTGGFARFARKDAVQVIRQGKITVVDVESLLTGKGAADLDLKPGDTVYVPESRF